MKTAEEIARELVGDTAIYPPDVDTLVARIAAALREAEAGAYERAAERIRTTGRKMYEHAQAPYEHAAGLVDMLAAARKGGAV